MSSDRPFDRPDGGPGSSPESSNGEGGPDPRLPSIASAESPLFNTGPERKPGVDPGYGSYGGGWRTAEAESEGIRVRYVLGVLVKRRWSAITVFLMVMSPSERVRYP